MFKNIQNKFNYIIEKIESLISEGNQRRIIVRDQEGDLFIEIPMLIGGIITIAAPYVTAIGFIVGFVAKFSIELVKKNRANTLLLPEKNHKGDV